MKKVICLFVCVFVVSMFYANQKPKVTNRVMSERVTQEIVGAHLYRIASAAVIGGMSARGLWAAAQLESGGNPNSVNGKYAGLINMGEQEFKKYGSAFGNRMDPLHNLIASSLYARENAEALRNILNRQPTDAELYISLQQGRSGIISLMKNPKAAAIDIRGYDAVVGNVPDALKKKAEKWTCAQFVAYWVNRFNEKMEKADV